jgi:stage II sporulation protein AA (anti-sigma F factor antagonist)
MRWRTRTRKDAVQLKIEVTSERGVTLIRCIGKIIYGKEAELFQDQLNQHLRQYRRCIVNMAGVTQIDAHGLGVLVDCYRRARSRGSLLFLVGVSDELFELLQLTRLSRVLEIYSTEEQAVNASYQAA